MDECYVCSKELSTGFFCKTHAKELFEILISGNCRIDNPSFACHCHICGEYEDRNILEYQNYLYCCDRDIVEDYYRYFKISNTDKPYLIEPWHDIQVNDISLEQEAYKKIGKNHILYNIELKAIARRFDRDDVLFNLLDNSERYAVVHLTWLGSRETDGSWPSVKVFKDINDWIINGMISDSKLF